MTPAKTLTDCNTQICVITFLGSLELGKYSVEKHTIFVWIDSIEKAIQMVRDFHDNSAVIEAAYMVWVLEEGV